MISAFVVALPASGPPGLRDDLQAAGVRVLGQAASHAFVPDVIRSAADVVICYEKHPGDTLFANLTMLAASAPRPVLVFTNDPDAAKIEKAAEAGIHAYVVDGYAPNRLRAVIHVAQARFRREQRLRAELSEISARFDERKLLDRAKGILMRARQIPEDEAYGVLRKAAMQSKQRLGQVAQHVINAALYSDAVNRAGQLRMASQRLVTFYALRASGSQWPGLAARFQACAAHIEDNIAILRRGLSVPTFGDLIDSVASPWADLKAAASEPPVLANLPDIDRLAGVLLENAERLTANLETAGLATKLRVINLAGRQRMLVQKMAKLALMPALIADPAHWPGPAQMEVAVADFTLAIAYLQSVPLSTPDIRMVLDQAAELWVGFQTALEDAGSEAGRNAIATLSEGLVDKFDRLTESYERGLQMLLE